MMLSTGAARWLIAAVVVLAIVALLAWARNDPGIDGRVPDPEDARAGIGIVDDGLGPAA
jgi:hypothetical protein